MSKCPRVIALGLLLLTAIGCDTDEKISRLEKQTEELKAEVSKNRATAEYDLQAKCSLNANAWFNGNYSRDRQTIVLDYTNHYNKSLNKCFISVENHYSIWGNVAVNGAWINDITLWDVLENVKYGDFAERHTILDSKSEDKVFICEAFDLNGTSKKCTTIQDFNALVRLYLAN